MAKKKNLFPVNMSSSLPSGDMLYTKKSNAPVMFARKHKVEVLLIRSICAGITSIFSLIVLILPMTMDSGKTLQILLFTSIGIACLSLFATLLTIAYDVLVYTIGCEEAPTTRSITTLDLTQSVYNHSIQDSCMKLIDCLDKLEEYHNDLVSSFEYLNTKIHNNENYNHLQKGIDNNRVELLHEKEWMKELKHTVDKHKDPSKANENPNKEKPIDLLKDMRDICKDEIKSIEAQHSKLSSAIHDLHEHIDHTPDIKSQLTPYDPSKHTPKDKQAAPAGNKDIPQNLKQRIISIRKLMAQAKTMQKTTDHMKNKVDTDVHSSQKISHAKANATGQKFAPPTPTISSFPSF